MDDYIEEGNICRIIALFVSKLDMVALGFKYADTKQTGRRPYNPATMLMLYLYGYLNRIRPSRRLEVETRRNVEVMWLMEKLTPDDRTICNFRKGNAKALKKVFRGFSMWCNSQGLYGQELEAVDGSKFRANANRKSIHTQKGTEKKLAEVEKKIEKYMKELEENDAAEIDESKLSSEKIREILKNLNDKKDVLNDRLKEIEENDGNEISTVDPDAHIMRTGGDGRYFDACYNVQTIVDEKHKLIVDFDVTTCPDDKGGLVSMAESAKEIMGVSKISATGDKGYYDGEDIEKCGKNGTVCYVPKTATTAHAPCHDYDKERFRYDKKCDCYICPDGKILKFKRFSKRGEGIIDGKIYENSKMCKNCTKRELCTKGKFGRRIARALNQDALDIVNSRMITNAGSQIFKKRKEIVEHPFGTIKYVWGFRQYLCRGQEMTTAEQSLAFLAYNFRRVFNIHKEKKEDLAAAFG